MTDTLLGGLMTRVMIKMPAARAAELALAGALLWGSEAAIDAAATLTPDEWDSPALADIARICVDAARDGTPVDPITVKGRLESRGGLEPVGGWGLTIVECLASFTVPAASPGWAEMIRAAAARRHAITGAVRAIQLAVDDIPDPDLEEETPWPES
jgi:replicative DNA helicase